MNDMVPNRKGTVTEYKRGHHYLTHTQWEDGHCEIEVHRCIPEILWHSCDQRELNKAFGIFNDLVPQNLISERIEKEKP